MAASGIGLLGALVAVTLVRPGPHLRADRTHRNPRYAIGMFRERGPRLANLGYFGHMWELYALWTWLPMFLLAAPAAAALPVSTGTWCSWPWAWPGRSAACSAAGRADRLRPLPAAVAALVTSGALLPALAARVRAGPAAADRVLRGLGRVGDRRLRGVLDRPVRGRRPALRRHRAVPRRPRVGFALTVVSIQLVPLLADGIGWRYAFLLLAPGPVLGAIAMRALGSRAGVAAAEPTES